MNNATTFANECFLILIKLNAKASAKGYEGYTVKSHDYYEAVYNRMIELGLNDFQINLNIVSIATGEFN